MIPLSKALGHSFEFHSPFKMHPGLTYILAPVSEGKYRIMDKMDLVLSTFFSLYNFNLRYQISTTGLK